MTEHIWVAGGMSEVGERLVSCSRCGIRRHWLGARDACPWLSGERYRVHEPRETREATDGALRWSGPYRREELRPCRRCSALFRRPVAMNVTHFCGPTCARQQKLERISARVAAHAERQRARS